ncbi:hypothetical protein ACOMHN_006083 [Nucella lapillus]
MVFCRLASLLSGMVSTTSQRKGKTTSSHCVLHTMQRQTQATLQESGLGGCGGSLTDACLLEGSSCQLAAVATPAILSNEISLTCYSREPRDP